MKFFSSGSTRLIQLNDEMKPVPLGMFMDQTSVVQTAQFVSDVSFIAIYYNGKLCEI